MGRPPTARATEPPPRAVDPVAALETRAEKLSGERRYEEALGTLRAARKQLKAKGGSPLRIAIVERDLGALHLAMEELLQARRLLQRALPVIEREAPGSEDLAHAVAYSAQLEAALGRVGRVVPLWEKALRLYQKARGNDHHRVAAAKRSLALRVAARDQRRAEALLNEAIATHDKLGEIRQAVTDRLALANVRRYHQKGDARALYREAIALARKHLGEDDLVMGRLWRALAMYNRTSSAGFVTTKQRAEMRRLSLELFGKAERVYKKVLGPDHSDLADLYADWSLAAEGMREMDRAVELRARSNDIEERHLTRVLSGSSEALKLAYLQRTRRHAEDTVDMHVKSWTQMRHHAGAARLAMTTVLRRKGRALDSAADALAAARFDLPVEDRALLQRLSDARGELARAIIRGPGKQPPHAYKRRLGGLETRAARLEAELERKSAAFRATATPVTIEAVQKAIPEKAVLVEIVKVSHRDERAYSRSGIGEARYGAYLLRRTGPVRFAYLGKASAIDRKVARLRKLLADPSKRFGEQGHLLFRMTFLRLEPLLEDVELVMVAPDGALNLVPFGTLIDMKGKPLVERYSFSYLSSGRDLLRFTAPSARRAEAAIFDNPAFDATLSAAAPAARGGSRGTSAGNLSRARFPALPGTAAEATAIAGLLPKARRHSGTDATEAALKRLAGPAMLHVATHGFFLDDAKRARRRARGLELVDEPVTAPPARPAPARPAARPKPAPQSMPAPQGARWRIRDPLLRSGLALSGANRRGGDGVDDGVLTGLEAAGLDLHGTRLVVLSACETGVGELKAGEGVFGLRRALVLAGSETQVMSLWKVDDDATRDLMVAYYKRLLDGEGRAAAMREVQRAMWPNAATRHPYFWGAFIVSGNPGPLQLDSGARAAGDSARGDGASGGDVPAVEPGARGCSCRAVGLGGRSQPPEPQPLWLWCLVLGVGLARRRW
jgi:CHAT domain-containing protein/tetratricopeptide (TPR) repeat protein